MKDYLDYLLLLWLDIISWIDEETSHFCIKSYQDCLPNCQEHLTIFLRMEHIQGVPEKAPAKEKLIISLLTGVFFGHLVYHLNRYYNELV